MRVWFICAVVRDIGNNEENSLKYINDIPGFIYSHLWTLIFFLGKINFLSEKTG